MNFNNLRNSLYTNYNRGAITESEMNHSFVALLIEADNDAAAFELCSSMPDDFRISFRDWLSKLADRDYKHRWFAIGDSRSMKQIETDSKRYQEFLSRLGPSLLDLLELS